MKTVVVPGALDTKGADYEFLVREVRSHDVGVLTVDFGILSDPPFVPDIGSSEVARAGGGDLGVLRESKDKTRSMRVMSDGLARVLAQLHRERRLDGVCGMGGTSGTAILSAAMRQLPIGTPKLLISTVASGDVSAYVGSADVTLMHSVVDVAGLNRISREVYTNAAAAIAGMVKSERLPASDRPIIAASMFGNTTPCVTRASGALQTAGFEVLVFHATGTGGRTMQRLTNEGFLAGLLDLTTTELADEVCGGIFTAGAERVEMAAGTAVPIVLAPGCVDMCNFGAVSTVPAEYRSRLLYEWNPNITLMRTSVEENRRIGKLLAETANRSSGAPALVWPLRGVSMLDSPGGPFWDEAADNACLDAVRAHLGRGIPLVEVDANINDPAFADRAVEMLLELLERPALAAGSVARGTSPRKL